MNGIPLEANYSKIRLIAFVVGSVVFFIFCAWLLVSHDQETKSVLAGYFGMVVSIITFWISLFRLFDKRVQLSINVAGVMWRAYSDTFIPWSEIKDIHVVTVKSSKLIQFYLKNSGLYKLGWFRRSMRKLSRNGDFFIAAGSLTKSHRDIMDAIEFWRSYAGIVKEKPSDTVFRNLEF